MPKRMFISYKDKIEGWEGKRAEAKLYEGMGHSTVGAEVRDLCIWLEKAVSENDMGGSRSSQGLLGALRSHP